MPKLSENIKFLHKVVMIHEDEILILKRSSTADSRPEKWDLPGGNAEWPATTMTKPTKDPHALDVVREILEETGIEVNSNIFADSLSGKNNNLIDFFSFFEPDRQVYSIACGWKLQLSGSKQERDLTDFDRDSITISDEHMESRWVKPNEIDDYDFGGEPGEFIKTIIRKAL